MRKTYQTAWHGVDFGSITEMSSQQLPDADFYSRFYECLFQRYGSVDELDPEWISLKSRTGSFIVDRVGIAQAQRILSIGAGLGLIEMALLRAGYIGLELTEVSRAPLRWIQGEISPEKVHTGLFPACLPDDSTYDFALLSSVEYFLDDRQLESMLDAVRERLTPGGTCFIVSWSIETPRPLSRLWLGAKDFARYLMEVSRIRHRGQFWGYVRRPQELGRSMKNAGFTGVCDGNIDTGTRWETYWTCGTRD